MNLKVQVKGLSVSAELRYQNDFSWFNKYNTTSEMNLFIKLIRLF